VADVDIEEPKAGDVDVAIPNKKEAVEGVCMGIVA